MRQINRNTQADFTFGVVTAICIGAAILTLAPRFLFWLAGIISGFGLGVAKSVIRSS
jgi:membrane glycosyltransferase